MGPCKVAAADWSAFDLTLAPGTLPAPASPPPGTVNPDRAKELAAVAATHFAAAAAQDLADAARVLAVKELAAVASKDLAAAATKGSC